jgi:hypothetical protein
VAVRAYSVKDTYAGAAPRVSSAGVSERSVVRLASGVVAALSLVLPLLMRVPESLPSTAIGSALLLYLERVLAVFAILLFLLVFLYRSLVHGELPKTVSGRGAEWSDLADTTAKELQTQIDELDAAVEKLRKMVERQRLRSIRGH